VKLKVGPLPFAFPNTPARQAAVKLHDLHHVATGYDTTFTGEAEIAAWELAAGCGRYYAAWILNLGAMATGMLIAPRRTARAFRRGRRSKSLYDRRFGNDLLAMTVGELRALLRIG
jgi:ubiquinone biosynthesis protein Coq4